MIKGLIKKANKIFNLTEREWPRVALAFSMTFLTRFGFIIGWSAMLATFLTKVGIEKLPILFLANAILVMLGTVFFRRFLHKINREQLIVFTILGAVAFMLSSIFFVETNNFLFFGLLLVSEAVLLGQLMIMLSLFYEELFTPLESQRSFPIIESAETIGGICGGLALSFLATEIPAYKFILGWAVSLLLILPIILKFNTRSLEVPKQKTKKKKIKKISESFGELRRIPFLKGIMLIVLLHWGMMYIVEYQYTKAIQQDVYEIQEETLVLASEEFSEVQIHEYEMEITKKLGVLHVIFNAAALVIQLILASRIISSLGIVSTLLIHPIVTLLNLVGLTLRYGFITAAVTKGSYELTGLLFKNSYDSSYYAIPHEKREDAKELMQGIMKPLGAILGTMSIFFFANITNGKTETFFLNILLVIMSIFMAFVTYKLSKKYTSMSEQNLSKKNDLATRLNAIEILGQKGHDKIPSSLEKILKRDNEPEIIKRSILNTFAEQKDIEFIEAILEATADENSHIRMSAARTLSKYTDLEDYAFTKERIINVIKQRLKKEDDENITDVLVKYFHVIAPDELTKYLLESIKKKKRASFIRMLRLFNDPNLIHYLEKDLENNNADIKAACIIVLWQFSDQRKKLAHYLKQMLHSTSKKQLIAGAEACGIVNYKDERKRLIELLDHKDDDISNTAVLALGHMEEPHIIKHIINRFIDAKHEWYGHSIAIMNRFTKSFKQKLKQ
ncbi:hypothetical protein HOK22_04580, partial [Candidatus Peregrinibacteria bacterium]|nr:hypothetical protein [Candidatus Peregrinibacteria bacterium]